MSTGLMNSIPGRSSKSMLIRDRVLPAWKAARSTAMMIPSKSNSLAALPSSMLWNVGCVRESKTSIMPSGTLRSTGRVKKRSTNIVSAWSVPMPSSAVSDPHFGMRCIAGQRVPASTRRLSDALYMPALCSRQHVYSGLSDIPGLVQSCLFG